MAADPNFNLRERLKALRITQVGFAALNDVDGTTVRTWVRLGTPGPARRLVELLEYETGISTTMPSWLVPVISGRDAKRQAG